MSPQPVRPEPVEGLPLIGQEENQSFDKLRTNGSNVCPSCETPGMVRPDIVWFGEMPYEMERIEAALMTCDLFVSIGTSGAVYPAAGFVQTAKYCAAKTLEINLEPSWGSSFFDERRCGRASAEVPKWVKERLKSRG